MLILRRKAGETLQIGEQVRITVMDIYEGGVRLAIDAPREITVLRSELLQAADANRDAAKGEKPQELLALLDRGGPPGERKGKRNKPPMPRKAHGAASAQAKPGHRASARPEEAPPQAEAAAVSGMAATTMEKCQETEDGAHTVVGDPMK